MRSPVFLGNRTIIKLWFLLAFLKDAFYWGMICIQQRTQILSVHIYIARNHLLARTVKSLKFYSTYKLSFLATVSQVPRADRRLLGQRRKACHSSEQEHPLELARTPFSEPWFLLGNVKGKMIAVYTRGCVERSPDLRGLPSFILEPACLPFLQGRHNLCCPKLFTI